MFASTWILSWLGERGSKKQKTPRTFLEARSKKLHRSRGYRSCLPTCSRPCLVFLGWTCLVCVRLLPARARAWAANTVLNMYRALSSSSQPGQGPPGIRDQLNELRLQHSQPQPAISLILSAFVNHLLPTSPTIILGIYGLSTAVSISLVTPRHSLFCTYQFLCLIDSINIAYLANDDTFQPTLGCRQPKEPYQASYDHPRPLRILTSLGPVSYPRF